ncbi:MAG: thioredoxin domain-containing protein, partial [Gemmatimonadota bacterium]
SLRVVFRHFPLARIHPLAERGAEVVEAAAASGCFWEMLDLMYANHDDLSEDAFHRFVRKLKLDSRRVSRELHEGLYRDRVRADYLGGLRSGVQGTPTFFINGTRYAGAIDFDAMVVALLQASQKQK